MRLRSVFATNYTHSAVVKALCAEGQCYEARNLVLDWKIHHTEAQNSRMLEQDAIDTMFPMPNTGVYNALMNGCVRQREFGMAKLMYEDLGPEHGLEPDEVTLAIMLSLCAKSDQVSQLAFPF